MKALPRKRFRWLAALAIVVAVAVAAGLLLRNRESPPAGPTSTSSLLALTWAPSLCPVEPGASGCRTGSVARRGAVFLLHGLWPQPSSEQYCDVPRNGPRPPVPLPDDLRAQLQSTMSDAAVLAPHEWYAHGTCSGVTAPEYFRISARLADQASAVLNPLFAGLQGRDVSVRAVRRVFTERFGSGAGDRVALSCKGDGRGSVAFEVRLSLPPVTDLSGTEPLRDALASGPVIAPGCGKARVP